MSDHALSARFAKGNSHRLFNPISTVQRLFRMWRDRRILEALDDHLLKDIGVHRCEIPWIAKDLTLGGDGRGNRLK